MSSGCQLESKIRSRASPLVETRAVASLCFPDDPYRRLSNIHFRIYLNQYGVLMLEDQSTNGTVVDDNLLKAKSNTTSETRRTLNSGSKIAILMHNRPADLRLPSAHPKAGW